MGDDLTKYKSDWVDNIKKKKDFLDQLKKIHTKDGTVWSLDHDAEIKMPWEVNKVEDDEEDAAPECTQEMAQRIMDALCADGRGDFLILKDDEIREWWAAITKKREAERDRIEAERRETELRENALKKLTEAERRALGLK